MNLPCTTETLLKRTTSRCPVCHAAVPGEVWKVNDGNGGDSAAPTARVFLRRDCPEHGRAEACIASDARFYWLAQGKPENQCCGGTCHAAEGEATGTLGRNASPPEINHGGHGGHGEHGGDADSDGTVNSSGKQELRNEPAMQPAASSLPAFLRDPVPTANAESSACPTSASSSPSVLSVSSVVKNSVDENTTAQERLSTCLALIEIVNSCNLACPTCYADSPQSRAVDAVPLADLQARIQGVIDRKGGIEILQLSGGEPTLHPQFFELLAWLHAHPGIDYVLLNTNGVRIANDDAFSAELGRTFQRGKFQLYLQFDGTQEAAQHWLRGADLRATRERAIARCRDLGIPLTLAMTVTPENLPHVWDAVDFGLRWENVRGISFQPLFGSGRVTEKNNPSSASRTSADEDRITKISRMDRISDAPSHPVNPENPVNPVPPHNAHLNTADVILALVEHSASRLRYEDFTPLPCGDPNCATIGYLLKIGGTTRSISDFVDFTKVQEFLRDKVRYSPDDLARCGCESEPLGELLHEMETGFRKADTGYRKDESAPPYPVSGISNPVSPAASAFRLFIKPFMDAWTWDEDRIDRCCTHVIRPDGKLDSFCRYYSGFSSK